MATLFSIIAANLYLRAQQQERNLDLLSAGLLAALAMMCKEHAVLLPLATVALTPLVRNWDRTVALRAAGFLFLLVPVCYWTISHRSEMIGTNYEIYAGEALTQMTLPQLFDFAGGTWAMSIATQARTISEVCVFMVFSKP
jgi:4-amino-4-deoxy-L-arabinose transferase-like glycosyltransferase